MTIYTSPVPPEPVPKQSIWSFLFSQVLSPSLTAFIDAPTGRTLSRGDFRALTLQFAHGLRSQHGVRRGDTVLILSPNSFAWPVMLLGLVAGGIRVSPANSGYTPTELAHQYRDSSARIIFVHFDFLPVVLDMFRAIGLSPAEARSRIIIAGLPSDKPEPRHDGFASMLDLFGHGALGEEERFDGELANETVLLCYSSGTTGRPKGVMVNKHPPHFRCTRVAPVHCLFYKTTHLNILTVLCGDRLMLSGLTFEKDVMAGVIPFYHIYGMLLPRHMGSPPWFKIIIISVQELLWYSSSHCVSVFPSSSCHGTTQPFSASMCSSIASRAPLLSPPS